MQALAAGLLRAMGQKTKAFGADRGKDILASPDGFGFQPPRIVIEVTHRNGRHKNNRGLYVSTGGFTKAAQYDAERPSMAAAISADKRRRQPEQAPVCPIRNIPR
ncbi:restriction endonuclease [Bordetella avium]|uniref:restriction endonuclease n=1 Tax=Bordetella avium TaxID=521 RepID=UPI000E0CAC5B|nr:restriction endonuclease [Bordetella avium]RIQ14761.1 hypothetical protein D0432_01110 [Bordetella avium]RIQ41224.1 hypothetical protein D0848_01750 [Bordetella avium]RIQ45988.1 hypothetical protein D0847_01830 [Bordetella avium]RIQ46915.1 hypothetical protein D0846_01835 [Bordetella avium]RIQ50666.1 hypothetical protein D0845_06785 [Bordetella avium]